MTRAFPGAERELRDEDRGAGTSVISGTVVTGAPGVAGGRQGRVGLGKVPVEHPGKVGCWEYGSTESRFPAGSGPQRGRRVPTITTTTVIVIVIVIIAGGGVHLLLLLLLLLTGS